MEVELNYSVVIPISAVWKGKDTKPAHQQRENSFKILLCSRQHPHSPSSIKYMFSYCTAVVKRNSKSNYQIKHHPTSIIIWEKTNTKATS